MTYAYRAPSHPGHPGMGYPCYVDPKPPRRYDAPAKGGGPSAQRSPKPSSFPRLDDHLVRPETREEMIDGRLVLAPPALEPHAEQHYELDYVTRGGVAPGYVGATDLLTRTGAGTQFAADTCIRREGIDPATGTRYLEELAFEVVNEQSLADVTKRARDLTTRGVRRIIAIFVKTNDVRDWSPSLDNWITLDRNGAIEDRTLAAPVPVRALLDRAAANRAVVQGLKAKQDPAILEIKEEGRQEGRAQMARTAIEGLCEILEIPFGPERQALLHTLDAAKLEALYAQIRIERRWP
jgi:hypothetical protein